MSWFQPKSNRPPEEIQVPRLRFMGEQDGRSERELKSHLAELFRCTQSVNTAYLAQVAYAETSVVVALCLRSRSEIDMGLTDKVGSVFASLFGGHEHLDIIFLSGAQEAEILKVCDPFFQLEG